MVYATGLPAMTFYDCQTCINDYAGADEICDGMMCAGICGNNTGAACQVNLVSYFAINNSYNYLYNYPYPEFE